MKVSIICVGKLKEKYLVDFVKEYTKRMAKYCKLSVIEIKDELVYDDSEASIQIALNKEAVNIIKNFDSRSYKICMAIEGKSIDSESFSNLIHDTYLNYSHIQFIIGGSHGISNEVKNQCDYLLSFSKLTFPHQIARCMLLEQIYRCFKIQNNEKYHK